MLIDVLNRVAADTGLHPVDKRATLLKLLDKSAKEMHKQLECSKIYREVTLVVMPDSVVSLPSFVGECKGMRIHTNEIPFDLANIGNPRYTNTTLQNWYKNWRDLGESPVHTVLSAIGQLTIETPIVEDVPVTLIINGNTNNAERIEEKIILDDTSKETTELFGPKLFTIGCVSNIRTSDIVIKDVNGIEIAKLNNNQNECRYKIMDVSKVFWPSDTSAGESLIDVLYKVPATTLSQDSDIFYAGSDYDDAWYNFACYFYFKPIQNRKDDAAAFHADAVAFMQAAKESGEGSQLKKLAFGRNKFYGLFRPWKFFAPGSVTNVDRQ